MLDLQGTDSAESGDGGKTFERQSSLLALALCDVVIVNVWSNDLGRADASNMSLLRDRLRGPPPALRRRRAAKRGAPPKTTLLFLIRDHIAEQTPLEKLEEMVHRDVASVWAAADKPDGFDGGVESVFAIQIAGLPHFVFQRAAFDDAAAALRRRFERGAPETLLPPPAADAVPLDGLGAYVRQLWSAIRAEEDLDLPTHKQALATHRCAQIADGLLRDARAALEPHRKAVEKTTIPLPSLLWCHAIAEECIRGYAAATKRYDKGRAAARRAELRAQLRAEAAPLVRANNALHVDAKTAEFEAALKAAVPADRVMPRFRLAVAAMAAEAEASLTSEVRESIGELPKLLDDDEMSGRHSPAADDGDGDGGGGELRALCDGAGAELRARVAAARDGALASQRALLLDAAKGAARDALTKALDTTLTKLPATTWADVARARDAEGEEATVRARFAEEIDGLAAEGSEAARAALAASLVPPLRRHAVEVVREGVGREVHLAPPPAGPHVRPRVPVRRGRAAARVGARRRRQGSVGEGEEGGADPTPPLRRGGGGGGVRRRRAARRGARGRAEGGGRRRGGGGVRVGEGGAGGDGGGGAAADVGVRRAPHPRRQRGDRHPLVELRPLAARARRDRRRRGGAQRARDADALRAPGVGANQRGGSREIARRAFKENLH